MAPYLETTTAPPPRALAFADEVPLYGGGRAHRLKIRRRIYAATSIVLTILLIGGTVYVLTQRNVTTTVSLSDAVKHFRTANGSPATATKTSATATSAVTTKRAAKTTSGTMTTQKTDAKVALPAVAVPYTLPAEGVYAYKTKGGESVSAFGASHTYPSEVFGSVRHLGGCMWQNRNDVIKEHVDIRDFCSARGSLTQLAQERQVTFFGKQDGARLDCTPALMFHETSESKGDTRTSNCTDHNGTNARLVATFAGIVPIAIGGVHVDSVRVHIDGTMTGRVEGTSSDDLWVDPTTGMTLRWDRTVDTLAAAFGAKVRYRENASFLLESLQPRG